MQVSVVFVLCCVILAFAPLASTILNTTFCTDYRCVIMKLLSHMLLCIILHSELLSTLPGIVTVGIISLNYMIHDESIVIQIP